MHIWNTYKLADQVKKDDLNEHQKKNYFIGLTIYTIAVTYLSIGNGTANELATYIESIVLILIAVVGINITFNTNHKNGGRDYIYRVTILSLPILVKLFVLVFLIGVVTGIIDYSLDPNKVSFDHWFFLALSIMSQSLYFWRINIHLKYINT